MALRPDEFYEHAVAAADTERRLPLARMTGWHISPFEQDGLRVVPLRPPVLPEPARHGEDPADCRNCQQRDEGIWFNDQWRLTRIPGVDQSGDSGRNARRQFCGPGARSTTGRCVRSCLKP